LAPTCANGLERVFRALHTRYAQHLNRIRNWNGHVWQGRYFSAPLDESYLWAAIRYVERNPVRARIVPRAEHYAWSSAAAHCNLKQDPLLTTDPVWARQLEWTTDWSAWLAEGDESQQLEVLRRNVQIGMPCGAEDFVRGLERISGRDLRARSRGRPKTP